MATAGDSADPVGATPLGLWRGRNQLGRRAVLDGDLPPAPPGAPAAAPGVGLRREQVAWEAPCGEVTLAAHTCGREGSACTLTAVPGVFFSL